MVVGLTPLLAVVLALGAFLRLAPALGAYRAPADGPDAGLYYALGSDLARLDGSYSLARQVGEESFRGSLYPALIASLGRASPPLSPGKVRVAQAALSLLGVAVVFLLGARLHSPAAGLLAAAALALNAAEAQAASSLNVQSFFSFLILVAAWRLAAWAEEPTERNSAWLGLAVGASLSCRSTLLFVPALAAARALALKGPLARRARLAGLVLAGAAAPLVPWTARNAWWIGEFVPLERHAAVAGLYAASRGAVETPDPEQARAAARAELPGLAGAGLEGTYRGMRRAALAAIASAPLAYAGSCARRLARLAEAFAAALPWPVAVLALLGALWSPTPGAAAVAGLLAYLFGVHALLAVNASYVLPFIAPACLLAGRGAGLLLERALRSRRGLPRALRPAPAPAWAAPAFSAAAAVPGLALAASVVFLSADLWAASPARAGLSGAELCERRNALGQGYFQRGDLGRALEQFTLAEAADPACADARHNRAVTLAVLRRSKGGA